MSLTPEQIQALLSIPQTRTSRVKTVNRDYQGWFKSIQKLYDSSTGELLDCENPDCVDPREGKSIVVVEIEGKLMCRYCFLDGWLEAPDDTQTTLDD